MTVKPEDIGLPSLNPARKDINDFYNMSFLPDGYPARQTERGDIPHPIYGTYVIADYLIQFEASQHNPVYLEAAKRVADAAISRMHSVGEALVFYYTPEMGLTSLPGTFFSGLTQARYLTGFARLWRASGDEKYFVAAEKVLGSLFITMEEGGVLRDSHGGVVIEEWPNHLMPDFTLNGWTTAIDQIAVYESMTGSERAKDLLNRNLIALRALLPLYDVPQAANTRYRLSGRMPTRIIVKGTTAEFVAGEVVIPSIGVVPYENSKTTSWSNYKHDGDKLIFNTNLNYISYPKPNKLRFALRSKDDGTAIVQVQTGDYHPLQNGVTNKKLETVGTFNLREGLNLLEADVPWETVPFVAYPTTHTKRVANRNFNAYHYIHISNLDRLFKLTGDHTLEKFANLWRSYVDKWPSLSIYNSYELEYDSLTKWQSEQHYARKTKDVS